ncbi:MAG: hypothetical protein ACXWQO_00010 [Bdellovibrionota bacterium]
MKSLTLIALALFTTLPALAEDNVQQVKIIGVQFGCSVDYPSGNPEIRVLTESKDGERKTTTPLSINDQDQLYLTNIEREVMILGSIDEGAKERIKRSCERGATSVGKISYTLFKDVRLFHYTEASSDTVSERSDCTGAMMGMVFGMPSGLAHLGGCKYYPEHQIPRTINWDAFVRGQNRLDARNYGFNWRRLQVSEPVAASEEPIEPPASDDAQ